MPTLSGVPSVELVSEAREAQRRNIVDGDWGTPRRPHRQRLESPVGAPLTPSTESLGISSSSSAISSPSLPVVPEPSAGSSRRRLRGKQPAPREEPPDVPVGAVEDGDLDWTGWPMEDDDPNRLRYWFFRRRLWTWMQQVTESAGVAPVLVERALLDFRSMPAAEKGKLMHLFRSQVTLPESVGLWASLQWPVAGAQGGNPRTTGGWLYAKSVMLTYNGEWGVLPSTTVPVGATDAVLVEHLVVEPSATALWDEFHKRCERLIRFLRPTDWAYSQEVCMQTWATTGGIRLHFHLYMRSEQKMWCATSEMFLWRDSTPHKAQHLNTFATRTQSGNGGMYYLVCPKIGLLRCASSKEPFTGFSVNPAWIQSMVSCRKMTTDDAREQYVACGAGLLRRLADLDKLVQCRREKEIEAKVRAIQEGLASTQLAFHPFPAIDAWRRSAEQPMQRRKKFLILEGGSGLGKTEYARAMYGADSTLELNCASCGKSPDLRRHDALQHRCILFDEASPTMVLANRKLFQAPAAWVDLGHSPTGRDVYRVFLNEAVLVVCSNGWSAQCEQLQSDDDKEWLQKNLVLVIIHGPMYIVDE